MVLIGDLILRPPAEHPLKEQLTKRTAVSEQRKLQQLFTTEELGDQKLLRRMLGDRPGITDGAFLRELFLQRLLYAWSLPAMSYARAHAR